MDDYKEEKKRADELRLNMYKLTNGFSHIMKQWSTDYNKEKKRAEKAEAKLKKTANELEKLSRSWNEYDIEVNDYYDGIMSLAKELSEDGK